MAVAKKRKNTSDFDNPWKEIIEHYFAQFMLFFFPLMHAAIDWSYPPLFLDKELQKIVRRGEMGKHVVDKLVRVRMTGGEDVWLYIHIEIQSQYEADFEHRVFVYYYRIRDRYGAHVVSLVILSDDRPNWRPQEYTDGCWGCTLSFRFPMVKLLDYLEQWDTLEGSTNPFATVVMAHLKAMETRKDFQQRKDWKYTLIRGLYERGYAREDILHLSVFIDWVMELPEHLEQQLTEEIAAYEEEQQMPYVTSFERVGIKKGLQQGRVEGLQQGLRKGFLSAIEFGLDLKFGAAGLALLKEIRQIEAIAMLQEIQNALRTATTLDELRRVYADALSGL